MAGGYALVLDVDPGTGPGVTGNLGIYHLQACRSYPGLKQDRWFCSEEQAQADGFRRAYNCRSPSKSK